MTNEEQVAIIDDYIKRLYPVKKWKEQSLKPTIFAQASKELFNAGQKQPIAVGIGLPVLNYKGSNVKLYSNEGVFMHVKFSWPLYLRNGKKSRENASELVSVLNALNEEGYKILINYYPSINSKERNIYSTPFTSTLCIESDHMTKEDQLTIMDQFKEYMVMQVDTGGKSIHNYFKFNILNRDHVLGPHQTNKRLADKIEKRGEPFESVGFKNYSTYIHPNCRMRFSQFDLKSKVAIQWFKNIGFNVDEGVASSINKLVRIPSFKHASGNVSKMIWKNDNIYENIPDVIDLIDSDNNSYDIYESPTVLVKEEKKKEEATYSNVTSFRIPKGYIEIMEDYYCILLNGFRSGERDLCNRKIGMAHKLLRYSSEESESVYSEIYQKSDTVKSLDDATECYMRFFESMRFKPYVPHLQSLDPDKPTYDAFKRRYKMICSRPSKGKYKMLLYILQKVQDAPRASVSGSLSLRTKRFNAVCKVYCKALQEFSDLGVVTCTVENFSDNRTRRYRICIPALLYILGYEDSDIKYGWDLNKKGELIEFKNNESSSPFDNEMESYTSHHMTSTEGFRGRFNH